MNDDDMLAFQIKLSFDFNISFTFHTESVQS